MLSLNRGRYDTIKLVGVPINVSRVNAFNRWMIRHSVDNYQKICGKW